MWRCGDDIFWIHIDMICVPTYADTHIYMCACECVCVWERGREREMDAGGGSSPTYKMSPITRMKSVTSRTYVAHAGWESERACTHFYAATLHCRRFLFFSFLLFFFKRHLYGVVMMNGWATWLIGCAPCVHKLNLFCFKKEECIYWWNVTSLSYTSPEVFKMSCLLCARVLFL